jgi:hypothetical protein
MVTCDEDPAPPATRLLSASLACGRITIQDIFIAIQGYFIAIKGTFWRLERPQPPASSDLGVRDIFQRNQQPQAHLRAIIRIIACSGILKVVIGAGASPLARTNGSPAIGSGVGAHHRKGQVAVYTDPLSSDGKRSRRHIRLFRDHTQVG